MKEETFDKIIPHIVWIAICAVLIIGFVGYYSERIELLKRDVAHLEWLEASHDNKFAKETKKLEDEKWELQKKLLRKKVHNVCPKCSSPVPNMTEFAKEQPENVVFECGSKGILLSSRWNRKMYWHVWDEDISVECRDRQIKNLTEKIQKLERE